MTGIRAGRRVRSRDPARCAGRRRVSRREHYRQAGADEGRDPAAARRAAADALASPLGVRAKDGSADGSAVAAGSERPVVTEWAEVAERGWRALGDRDQRAERKPRLRRETGRAGFTVLDRLRGGFATGDLDALRIESLLLRSRGSGLTRALPLTDRVRTCAWGAPCCCAGAGAADAANAASPTIAAMPMRRSGVLQRRSMGPPVRGELTPLVAAGRIL